MKKFKFPKLVIKEAKALKKHCTKEEKNNLTYEEMQPESKYRCIYGLLTGHCDSLRAVELIQKCCSRVYNALDGIYIKSDGKLNPLNGSPRKKQREDYWSPIEVFIVRQKYGDKDANKKLIKFIKGEIKTLA